MVCFWAHRVRFCGKAWRPLLRWPLGIVKLRFDAGLPTLAFERRANSSKEPTGRKHQVLYYSPSNITVHQCFSSIFLSASINGVISFPLKVREWILPIFLCKIDWSKSPLKLKQCFAIFSKNPPRNFFPFSFSSPFSRFAKPWKSFRILFGHATFWSFKQGRLGVWMTWPCLE